MLPETADRIADEGAKVVWVDGDYDEAVRGRAAAFADEQPGRALVQDTAWEGYEQVPAWIVEGYQTLLDEVDDQLGRPRTWSLSRSGSGRWPRRWCGTTDDRDADAPTACSRSSPTPQPACWPA